jgi:hypothetical protein
MAILSTKSPVTMAFDANEMQMVEIAKGIAQEDKFERPVDESR